MRRAGAMPDCRDGAPKRITPRDGGANVQISVGVKAGA